MMEIGFTLAYTSEARSCSQSIFPVSGKGQNVYKVLNVVNKFKISVASRDATAILLKRILMLYNYQIEAITQVLYISFIIKLR